MKKIPFISGNQALHDEVQQILIDCKAPVAHLLMLDSREKAIEYLNIEMPDLLFLDFTRKEFEPFKILEEMMVDPWLLHGSIIALSADGDSTEKELNQFREANILVVIPLSIIHQSLPKVISIIENNRRIIFQRQIGSEMVQGISGSFTLENDLVEAHCHGNLIANYLFYTNKINLDGKFALNVCLCELLTNAIEHGNCEINYDEKSAWLEQGHFISQLIEKKNKMPEFAGRKVVFEYSIQREHSHFKVIDEGKGFNWKARMDVSPLDQMLELHGRGIFLSKAMTTDLSYNEKGNEVSFGFQHQTDGANLTPGLFKDIEPVKVSAGEIVFSQGEESNCLFYIVKGRYEVLVNGKAISQLTPDDIFLGEMSFLLGDSRSATIKSLVDGELIKIAKKSFFSAIKQKPHYALMLCRLLAQRINRVNLKFGN